jgi:hypothetical protein
MFLCNLLLHRAAVPSNFLPIMKMRTAKGTRGEYKTKDFIAETLGQASSYLGIPVAILRYAKKKGCQAFRHGKIHCGEVQPWLEANPPDISGKALPPKEDVQVLNLLEDLQKKRNVNTLFRGEYMKKADVSRIFTSIALNQRQVLIQELQNNLPPKLEGLRAPEMIVIMGETADRILAMMRAGIDSIKEAEKNRTAS